MLSFTERLLFILLVAISLAATAVTFNEMRRIIERGEEKLRLDDLFQRALRGLWALIFQGGI